MIITRMQLMEWTGIFRRDSLHSSLDNLTPEEYAF